MAEVIHEGGLDFSKTIYDNLDSLDRRKIEEAIRTFSVEEGIIMERDKNGELVEIIKSTLNNSRVVTGNYGSLFPVVSSPQEMLEVMKLRSRVYQGVPYFKDSIDEPVKGLNYDHYDSNSVNFLVDHGGTMKFILDSNDGLPTDEVSDSIQELRKKGSIVELSRFAIDKQHRKTDCYFQLFAGAYGLGKELGIDYLYFTTVNKDVGKYINFGGVSVIDSDVQYHEVPELMSVSSWHLDEIDPALLSKFESLNQPLYKNRAFFGP